MVAAVRSMPQEVVGDVEENAICGVGFGHGGDEGHGGRVGFHDPLFSRISRGRVEEVEGLEGESGGCEVELIH